MEFLKWILVLTLMMKFHVGTCRTLANNTEVKDPITKAEENKYADVAELEDLRRQVVEIKKKMRTSHFDDPGPYDVYFTISLKNTVRGIAPGQKVVYDNVINNGGNGYDVTTGVFTVPTAGVYHFIFFCNSLKAGYTLLNMKHNGVVRGDCDIEPAYDGEDETGGDVFTGRLNQGDEMWVEVAYSDTSDADLHADMNTFSGVLIHR